MDAQFILSPTYKLNVNAKQSKHWIIIGAGGNGGYLIPQLARQIALQNRILRLEGRQLHAITIIDADKVKCL